MQTILGAGGAIGNELAKALPAYTDKIRLVSRNPKKVNATDELFAADVTKYEEVAKALEGAEVAYLTVGLPYNKKVWQRTWPVVMKNVIDACKLHHTQLVFFDNIYLYDPSHLNPITEDTPENPSSEKGKVRAQIAHMLWGAVAKNDIRALIARSADFYGPSIKKSCMLTETVFNPLSKHSKATWLGNPGYKHSFTYTPDAGRATALLGNTEDAYGQVWHLPTAPNPYTGKEWIQHIANELGVAAKYRVANKSLVKMLGIFMPIMRELVEMMYQYEQDYVFNSDKFEKRFSIKPTPYADGIKEIVKTDYLK